MNSDYSIIAKYIHGSEDSTDIDVHYVFNTQPSFIEAKAFCDSDKSENRNVISIKDGVVVGCYKGTIDEINNALLDTYSLHEQEYPLLVTKRVNRDSIMKLIRSIRIILSHLSRSQYRVDVKEALRSDDWNIKLDVLDSISLSSIGFNTLNKRLHSSDILKVITFQIGQASLLMDGIEVYTKSGVCEYYPELSKFVHRDADCDISILDKELHKFISKIRENCPCYKSDDGYMHFSGGYDSVRVYDVINEKRIG